MGPDDKIVELSNQKKRSPADGKNSREEKRRKWEAKQARRNEAYEKEQLRSSWIERNATFAYFVTEDDAKRVKERSDDISKLQQMLLPYVDIQGTSKGPGTSPGDPQLFLAEGTETVRLLIQLSTEEPTNGLKPLKIKSIFVKPNLLLEDPVNLLKDVEESQSKRLQRGMSHDSPGFDVLIATEATISQVAGFQVSRGAIACGVVPTDRNEDWIEKLVCGRMSEEGDKKIRLLALDGICDAANLGSMIRCASAFGIDAIVLSKDTCDAWYRRSIRVSMGHIFRVPVVRVQSLSSLLSRWTRQYPTLYSYAAVIDQDASILENIKHGTVPLSWCCIMGNESQGITSAVARASTQRVRIDMEPGVDSLSVPIACGILLHGLREREGGM